jgi:predicted phosphohydrolase
MFYFLCMTEVKVLTHYSPFRDVNAAYYIRNVVLPGSGGNCFMIGFLHIAYIFLDSP